ncbi:MAG: peptidoglycan-binding domain-containing protein, partial [Alphaproteobacteria bacterium]
MTVVVLVAGALIGAGRADPAPADVVVVAAAIDPGEGGDPAIDADLVRAVQRRLAELGLFRGPVDGRQSLALDIAVREAQRSLGLREDGLISPEFLARLEGVAEKAQALRRRLDEARERQSREARTLLAASPTTADLVGGAG